MTSVDTFPPSLYRSAGEGPGSRRSGVVYVSLGRELMHQAVARTSERTYQDYFRCLKLFRVSMGQPVGLLAGSGVDSPERLLLAYNAYAWGTNGLTAGTIAGDLAAVKFFHRKERGLEPPVDSRGTKGADLPSCRGRDQVAYTYTYSVERALCR